MAHFSRFLVSLAILIASFAGFCCAIAWFVIKVAFAASAGALVGFIRASNRSTSKWRN